ncbi:FecCD family ABC transporter permease [Microbacterium pygmaeum]|uniref:Iron complex transport system permease protein n=1 Tax=Microbacterium pygmaeum TaxID=370764 RepID=A0A1G8BA63_9MICO|nr:iron chelate uptake ABC transporter family permease subunit [Microbacterium pygmaeum]SDH30085.1 iron complex transport system permease protein [Microbacterium pygmaeum]
MSVVELVALASVPPAVDAVRRRARRRKTIVLSCAIAVAVVLAVLALSLGDYPLSPAQLWQTMWGGGSRAESYVLFQVRMPRLMMALVAGAALGVAGALLQGLLGNPLASPDLLGISGGSGVAAVFALVVIGTTGPLLAVAAFAGGMAVAALLLLAGRAQLDAGYRLILAGVGLSFLCIAVIDFLMVRAKIEQTEMALLWLTGSLSSTPWWQVATVAAVLLLVTPALVASARWLPLIQLGSPAATGLGVRPVRVRVIVVLSAVLLTAVTCAFVGPISFIALCAPAIARPLLGGAAIGLGTSAVIGASLLAASDLVAQFAIPGLQLPVGVVTGAVGAVFLLWLLASSKGRHL